MSPEPPAIQTFDILHNLSISTFGLEDEAHTDVPFGEKVRLNFYSHNQLFDFELRIKRDLFTKDAKILELRDDGEFQESSTETLQHIAYEAINLKNGFARVTMLNSNEFSSLIKRNGELYMIKPSRGHYEAQSPELRRST